MLDVRYAGAAVLVVLGLTATTFLASPAAEEGLSPVQFDDTLKTGMTGVDVGQAEDAGYVLPRAQVFYSQYEYVVGYYGLEAVVDGLAAAEAGGYFGDPMAVFVTDFAGSEPTLTDEGYVRVNFSTAVGWVPAAEAHYVVDSGARTPAGPTPLPFAERSAAAAFAAAHDGTVVSWDRVRSRFGSDSGGTAERFLDQRAARTAWANGSVSAARALRERDNGTVVVGDDAPTLEAALERAPANGTVRLPPGTFEGDLDVEKPLSIVGAGNDTVIRGDGTGSVLTVRSPRVALTDLRVTGVGDRPLGNVENATGEGWDERIQLVYGRGDAAVRLADAHGALVANVTIDTPTNGVAALNTSGAVVENVTVDGNDDRWEGGMGVIAMYSDLVVQDSAMAGGRDGVYTHHSHGVVIRDNTMADQRFGVHEMFTSRALVENNSVRGTDVGIIVMTRPAGNVLVDNDVRDSEQGISTSGAASYAAGNVLVNNGIGLSIGTDRSYYARNTVVRNDVGVRSATLLPTNEVVDNDVVDNDEAVTTGSGVQNVWAVDGRGNYWGSIPGVDRNGDGVVDRSYRPASRLDGSAAESHGAASLAHAPAVGAIREFQSQVPGLRGSSVIDPAPLARPVRPGVLEDLGVEVGA